MAKRFDPKAKAKRQKIVAGVLGLVLVGVLIFQAPTILGMFGGSSSSTASVPAPTPPPAAPATPAAPGAPATPAPPAGAGSASLVDTDPEPTPTDGQLVSFDRFESKDPFVQQVGNTPPGGPAPAPTGATGASGASPAGTASTEPKPVVSSQPVASKPTAKIAVNGSAQAVTTGTAFPKTQPIFKLVSLENGTARVGIVGGGYANGSPTISLKRGGKAVTLMNTADGTSYVLRYLG